MSGSVTAARPGPSGEPAARAEPRTVREALQLGAEFLERRGVENARREAELLLGHALALERLQLFLALDRPLERSEVARARELLVRRGRREPAAYLTGRREFYGRAFRVAPGVLVPRPESELLVDRARALVAGRCGARIAELGTGSGCLAITLALELETSRVLATDVSSRALALARENAAALGAAVEFRQGDFLAPLSGEAPVDLLLMNPPYVDPAQAAALPPEVKEHEPAEALFAPAGDPDHWVRRLLDEGLVRVAPGGRLLVELGHDQAPRVRALLAERGLAGRFERDLERVERVLEVARPGTPMG